MKWTNLPSLNSLKAFCAVAETGSYSQAAIRLNVTHAAVSQQIKNLEAHLGLQLIIRDGRGISLTEWGVSLARDVGAGFETIRKGVEAVTGADAARPVQITMSPAFAVEWFMPRMSTFQQKHPEVRLLLNPTSEVIEPRHGGIDLAIRYTDQRRLRADATVVLKSDMVVIGTPELVSGHSLENPAALLNLPWLQELGTNEVAEWFSRQGVEPNKSLLISQMPGNLIMQSVRRGDGITYTVQAFFDQEIRSGNIVRLFSERQFGAFYLETAASVARPPVAAVVEWLKEEADATVD
ncbi:HTH-type transcriptional activator AmpR [Roseibium album]|nr:HTH-type transcriptional activator AmpR [Roseibium album]